MTYLNDLNTYLHQSSLLIQAYPTTRITTKYSLPKKTSKPSKTSKPPGDGAPAQTADKTTSTASTSTPQREKRDPSATLTLKTFHAESGICLKYRTDKAQEVSRLISGLGRLAQGEVIEMPAVNTGVAAGDKMDLDEPAAAPVSEKTEPVVQPQQQQAAGKKKKKGKK